LSLPADSGAYKASLDSALLVFADAFAFGARNGEFDPDDMAGMAGDFHLEQSTYSDGPEGERNILQLYPVLWLYGDAHVLC
jgi:hypothetical protein